MKVKMYDCPLTGEQFSTKVALIEHSKLCHESCKKFHKHMTRCQLCEYVSWRQSKIDRHLATTHQFSLAIGGREHRCQCDKYATADKSNFKRHVKNCGKFKYILYRCQNCVYNTNRKSNVERHCNRFKHEFLSYRCANSV